MTRTIERSPRPAQTTEALQALASDFEAAFHAQRPFFYGSGRDEESDAATAALMRSRGRSSRSRRPI